MPRRDWPRLFLLIGGLLAGASGAALECPPLLVDSRPTEELRFGHGLLFKVSAGMAAVSHVFGTIHVSDPVDPALPQPVIDALTGSTRFLMEVVLDDATVAAMGREMFYDDGRMLAETVGTELAEQAAALLERHGIPRPAAIRMRAWAAFTTLSMPSAPQGLPLDMLLMQRARALGIEIGGLETLAEQTQIFTALSDPEQAELLMQAVCFYDTAQDDLQTLMRYYEARDLAALLALSTRYRTESPELEARFLDALLWQRNARMLERMRPLLDRGGVFVAVGALHLAGRGGLLELLADRGYRIERVY